MKKKQSSQIGAIIIGALVFLSIIGLSFAALAQDASRQITIVIPKSLPVVDSCSMSSGAIGILVKQNIVETLTQLDPKNSDVLPRLAMSWNQLNATTWRFKLRQGVQFHDGTPFNAGAVAAAIDRTLNTTLECLERTRVFPGIKLTSKVVDNYTIDIAANQPLPLMPIYMAQLGMNSPKTDNTKLTQNPVGTGPYVFTSQDTQRIVLTRFEGYWGKKPEVQRATYVWRSESAVRASMVQVGEADIALDIALSNANNPKTDIGYLNSETSYIRIVRQPPLDDIRVRLALNLAIDRKAFIGTILSPNVMIATQQMLPMISGYNPDLEPWPYDPDRAKKLIQEARAAGAPVDKEIILYARSGHYVSQEEVLQSMMQMWQRIGLNNIKLRMMEQAQYNNVVRKPYPENPPPRLLTGMHDNSFGDAAFTMFFNYHSKGAKSDLEDPVLDKMLDEAATLTGPKRRQIFQEANKYIQKIIPDIMMYHMVSCIRISPRLEYQPDLTTGGKLEISDIKFKK